MRVDFFVAGQKTLIHYPTVHPFLTGSGRQFFNASSCLSRFMVIAICHSSGIITRLTKLQQMSQIKKTHKKSTAEAMLFEGIIICFTIYQTSMQ